MGLFNRYTRTLLVALITITMGLFALKAYAATLEVVPPAYLFISDGTAPDRTYRYIADLNRGRFYRDTRTFTQDSFRRMASPDGSTVADFVYTDNQWVISLEQDDGEFIELGRYAAIFSNIEIYAWSPDSSGIYLVRENSNGMTLFFVDVETGDAIDIVDIDLKSPIFLMSFISNNMLQLGGAATVFINIDTQEYTPLPVATWNILGLGDDLGYAVYFSNNQAGVSSTISNRMNLLNTSNFSVESIDLVDLPSPITIDFNFSPRILPDTEKVIAPLAGDGLALISLTDGNVDIIHDELIPMANNSHNTDWIAGRLEYRNDNNIRWMDFVAVNATTGEEVLLLSGREGDLREYEVLWSPRGDMVLLADLWNSPARSDDNYYDVRIVAVPSGDILVDDRFLAPVPALASITWFNEWLRLRYPEEFQS